MGSSRVERRAAAVLVAEVLLATLTTQVAPAGSAPLSGDTPAVPVQVSAIPDLAALGWVKVFDDDFNGSSVDPSKWEVAHGDHFGIKNQAAAIVSGGQLQLRTYTENGPNCGGSGQPKCKSRSAAIQSASWTNQAPVFESAYGYVEAKIKLHDVQDQYTAFWMMSRNMQGQPLGDPQAIGPEIDILDGYSVDENGDGRCDWGWDKWNRPLGPPCKEIGRAAINWNLVNEGFYEDVSYENAHFRHPIAGKPFQDNWYTYGLLWTPEGYRIYYDGVEVFRTTSPGDYTPHYLILSQHLTGPGPVSGYGALGASGNGVTTIDYVQVWQRPVSEVQNQTAPSGQPVSIPFSVADYAYVAGAVSDPGSVRVTATATDPSSGGPSTLVPNGNLTVTGNGPAVPGGSFDNGGFEEGTGGLRSWTPSGPNATSWTGRFHTGSRSLRLTQGGGQVTQRITGLDPNTTYAISGFYNLELAFTDTHKTDPTEPLPAPSGADGRITWIQDSNNDGKPQLNEIEPITGGDTSAKFTWGIQDVDTSRSGDQTVSVTQSRDALTDASKKWWATHNDAWVRDSVKFTTGPNTNEVTLFVSNQQFAGTGDDSDLSFDSLVVQPHVPPNRAVTVLPATDDTGTARITLNAVNAANQTLGTEQFDVTFQQGSSFTNGNFELTPAAVGWELYDGHPRRGRGADVVVEDPFRLNRILRISYPFTDNPASADPKADDPGALGIVRQQLTGLRPNTDYSLTLRARTEGASLGLDVAVQDHNGGGSQVATKVTSTTWTPVTLNFKTGPSSTSAQVVLVDWTGNDGASFADDVKLAPVGAVPATPVTYPVLTSMGEQTIPSSAPVSVPFTLPAGARLAYVLSENQDLVPNRNLRFAGGGSRWALSLTPVADRTGTTRVTVIYLDANDVVRFHDITFTVADNRLVNPGFEARDTGWALNGNSIETTGQRSGSRVLRLSNANQASQYVPELPHHTRFVLGGYVKGTVDVAVYAVEHEPCADPGEPDGDPCKRIETLATGQWSGGDWAPGSLQFDTSLVPGGRPDQRHPSDRAWLPTEIAISDANPNDGPSLVDDLTLGYGPMVSLPYDQTLTLDHAAFGPRTQFAVGRLPSNAMFDPATISVTATDTAPNGDVINLSGWSQSTDSPNLSRVNVVRPSYRPGLWDLLFRARQPQSNQVTGKSDITVTVTDPRSGATNSRTFAVTVNAGNVTNSHFTSSTSGWTVFGGGTRIPAPSHPQTQQTALYQSKLYSAYRVTGLGPGQRYVLRVDARGTGSKLLARQPGDGTFMGAVIKEVAVNSASGWATYEIDFTMPATDSGSIPGDESRQIWIVLEDTDQNTPASGSGLKPVTSCAQIGDPAYNHNGSTCFDNVGLFRYSDVHP